MPRFYSPLQRNSRDPVGPIIFSLVFPGKEPFRSARAGLYGQQQGVQLVSQLLQVQEFQLPPQLPPQANRRIRMMMIQKQLPLLP